MKSIVTLDIGHTTGIYWGIVENDTVDYLGSKAQSYPLNEKEQADLLLLLTDIHVLIMEYPIINRISSQQAKTKEVTNWWSTFIKSNAEIQLIIQPSMWKPPTKGIREQVLPTDRNYTVHERDAACMAWWWARWRSGIAK